jgi:hypothetical protein
MACHFAIAGLMASRGHHVDSVDGNANLKWSITGPPGKGVIACSYIFVAVYGFTWVRCCFQSLATIQGQPQLT